jgi:hypothetical protein
VRGSEKKKKKKVHAEGAENAEKKKTKIGNG